jgi:hypothetical protein
MDSLGKIYWLGCASIVLGVGTFLILLSLLRRQYEGSSRFQRLAGVPKLRAFQPDTTSLSLAYCLEHSRFKRLVRCRAIRGHKLKRGVVALACVDGSGE